MTTPEDAFQQLAGVFASRGNKILEIEIIPSSLGSSFLQDGCFIGITKKALVRAFTVARHLFTKRLLPMTDDDLRASLEKKEDKSDLASDLVVTEIMLLFDCEHLTACNWRKRRLLAAAAQCLNHTDPTLAKAQLFDAELTLLRSYQCSPLHRHTKSPTLWSHRLWVLDQWLQAEPRSAAALFSLERAELDIVLRAAERHPKNYYAFTYMRGLQTMLENRPDGKSHPNWAAEWTTRLLNPVLNWCLANPRDISGWAFGLYLLQRVPEPALRADAVSRVLQFARDVGWDGESLWTFVDLAVRQFDLESVIAAVFPCDREPTASISRPSTQSPASTSKWAWKARLERAQAYWGAYGATQ
ncbi:hypothetical protein N7462_006415 [Penicillium macrosclerotiorum]|uniref:uncharacterized protein n=1 Tax=Penicillium macrosclerotiorum TaxID=303699 RepID=UPI0025471901|nr:uncharacterized protein N7462_006415 [Penicillium macrosclerotiorum]KAJ5683250.1 hypothetical protein N7462_006415 [Penicillium macrosclerotiorum]